MVAVSRPILLLYLFLKSVDSFSIWLTKRNTERVMFPEKHGCEGYYSANFFGEIFPVIASDRVIKGYKKVMRKR